MDASAVRVPPLQRFSSAPRLQGRILAPQDAWHLSPCPLPQQLQVGVWESFRSAFIAKFARNTPICYSVVRTSCLYRLPVVSSQVLAFDLIYPRAPPWPDRTRSRRWRPGDPRDTPDHTTVTQRISHPIICAFAPLHGCAYLSALHYGQEGSPEDKLWSVLFFLSPDCLWPCSSPAPGGGTARSDARQRAAAVFSFG